MSKAMLIDTTRCIGCRGCQVACKSWHNLPGERTTFSETWSNPRHMNSNNYTRIIFREVAQPEGKLNWYFVKRQCMHCLDPACESVCPVGALTKLKNGPVVYDDDTLHRLPLLHDGLPLPGAQVRVGLGGAADPEMRLLRRPDRDRPGAEPAPPPAPARPWSSGSGATS